MGKMLAIEDIVTSVLAREPGLVDSANWGERAIFYNPGNRLPKGIYLLTFKQKDGPNDAASRLDRGHRYRLNLGLSKNSYSALFGETPARPAAGGIVATGHDFTLADTIMPHPVYAWMNWIGVINPSRETFETLSPLIEEALISAKTKFEKRLKAL